MLAKALQGAALATQPAYIEDVFSTYVYAGTSSAITVNNGIDLSGKGGLVWIKNRSSAVGNRLWDTVRGGAWQLGSQDTTAQASNAGTITFNSSGFSTQSTVETSNNQSGSNYVSWTFRKQAKFFDVVTYTGNGSSTGRNISHSLGSVPGCIIVKATSAVGSWWVYHRGTDATVPAQYGLELNSTAARNNNAGFWANTAPTASVFTVGGSAGGGLTNVNGVTYVAYLFAHDAGGFGASGTDNVISCGSYTGNGIDNPINLGYEPQWVLVKKTNSTSDWYLMDNMRGVAPPQGGGNGQMLYANLSNAEAANQAVTFYASGFNPGNANVNTVNANGSTYIYIAIRRGPMRTPTSGTSVFTPLARTGTGANAIVSAGFPTDFAMICPRTLVTSAKQSVWSRLQNTGAIYTTSTNAEAAQGTTVIQANPWDNMTGIGVGTTNGQTNASTDTYVNYLMRRAPGFFDVVCYTGTGANRTVSHNLGVAPELMIIKNRTTAGTEWAVYAAPQGATKFAYLNDTAAFAASSVMWNDTSPTSSVFTVGTVARVNGSGNNLVAYLFATVAGVSKVGSYTGTGTTKQIDCGFTNGSRFVMIKRTDSTGDWYVWDSARGIVAGNDPYLLLNSTAAEVTNTDYIDTSSAGFEISSTAPAAINANGGTFIFLAIA